jgi:hypothetical protein
MRLSGFRMAVQHGTKAGDALILRGKLTFPVGSGLWALGSGLWVAGTFGAVYIGWRLPVLRA